jgi:hypothetical protein
MVNYGDSLLVLGKLGMHTLRIRMPGSAAHTLLEGTMLSVGWTAADIVPVSDV